MTNVNKWSTVPSSNADIDGNIWPEGQSAGSVNNAARNNMAAIARWREDLGGVLKTSGSSTAYVATSNSTPSADAQVLRTGWRARIRFHTACSSAPTLQMDGGTAKTIKKEDGSAMAAHDISSGVPEHIFYSTASGAFRVLGPRASDFPATTTASTATEGTVQRGNAADLQKPAATNRYYAAADFYSAAVESTLSSTGNSTAWDMSAGIDFSIDLKENTTIANPSCAVTGKKGRLRAVHDSSGGYTIAWGTAYAFTGGTAPTASTAASKQDHFYYDVVSTGTLRIAIADQIGVST